jgi:hypothetical protein
MEHDGASIETISISANAHEIRTLNAAPTAYLAMRGKGLSCPYGIGMDWLISLASSHIASAQQTSFSYYPF